MAKLSVRIVLRTLGACALMSLVTACGDNAGVLTGDRASSNAQFFRAEGVPVPKVDREQPEPEQRDSFDKVGELGFVAAAIEPQSTFSASVDTASYTVVRAMLRSGQKPPSDAVRIADFVNYFDYAYPHPQEGRPLGASLELASCPWQPKHHLLRVAVSAKTLKQSEIPARNLVFLIDTSGSMNAPNRLPLVQQSLRMLVDGLTEKDRVSIVAYAGRVGEVLAPTSGDRRNEIIEAISKLSSGGSTNGAGGIRAAYDLARRSFIHGGSNRVILATDGDFNVGITSDEEMVRLIEQERDSGVFLTVLGFGMGNLKDSKLEKLSRHGNGSYAYIDQINEAVKVFGEFGGSLVTVAQDVKLQLEFDPVRVRAYRLIGYENRIMKNEDFRNDSKDAGEVHSGLTVTALYEIVPVGAPTTDGEMSSTGKRAPAAQVIRPAGFDGWATLRIRYKLPNTTQATELSWTAGPNALSDKPSTDFLLASAAAEFGMLLRNSPYRGSAGYDQAAKRASSVMGADRFGYRRELVELIRAAKKLDRAPAPQQANDRSDQPR